MTDRLSSTTNPDNQPHPKSPWIKFYPADWRADSALRSCPLASRGLWMEMLCIMHEASPRGYLRINGKPVTNKQLAAIVGVHTNAMLPLMLPLELHGVLSRNSQGEIFCRRMVREEDKLLKDIENGMKGGNPNLKRGVNPQDKAHMLDARSYSLERKKEDTPSGSANGHLVEEGDYAFESGVIRLKAADLDRWQKSFTEINVKAELESSAEWICGQAASGKNWFFAAAGLLGKRNRDAKARREIAAAPKPSIPGHGPWSNH